MTYIYIYTTLGSRGGGGRFWKGLSWPGWPVAAADAVTALLLLPGLEAAVAVLHRHRRSTGRLGLCPGLLARRPYLDTIGQPWAYAQPSHLV